MADERTRALFDRIILAKQQQQPATRSAARSDELKKKHAETIAAAQSELRLCGRDVAKKVQVVAWVVIETRIAQIPQLADVLGIAESTLYRWADRPSLSAAIEYVSSPPAQASGRIVRGVVAAGRNGTDRAIDGYVIGERHSLN